VVFQVAGHDEEFTVFTTRPDTLFGATYIVLAPEHPLVKKIVTDEQKDDVQAYIEDIQMKSDLERTELMKEKTGVFTGAYAINPVNEQKIPIWIADYVLMTYGTGAIMAVPAHDERDYEFAKTFDLPIVEVVAGGDISKEPYIDDGKHINSNFLNGLYNEEAIEKMIEWLEEDGSMTTVPEDELPLELPDMDEIKPSGTGESPLANSDWIYVTDPETGMKGRRETNTMPQWAGSSWYFLRFIDPHNSEQLADPE